MVGLHVRFTCFVLLIFLVENEYFKYDSSCVDQFNQIEAKNTSQRTKHTFDSENIRFYLNNDKFMHIQIYL